MLCLSAKVRRTGQTAVPFLFLFHIMVSVDHVKTILFVEQSKEPEYIIVNFYYLVHFSVFPQFISITKLYIGKSLCIVMVESCEVQILIF